MKPFLSVLSSLTSIFICAGLGTLIASAIGGAFGWQGTWMAFVTLLLSMFFAFVFFVIGVALLRVLRARKTNK
jgi:hypothetical protein